MPKDNKEVSSCHLSVLNVHAAYKHVLVNIIFTSQFYSFLPHMFTVSSAKLLSGAKSFGCCCLPF